MAKVNIPTFTLNNGIQMPALGYGTWLGLTPDGEFDYSGWDKMVDCISYAIDVGYRHIDTAHLYRIEPEIGQIIKKKIQDGVVKREDLFITTKVWPTYATEADAEASLRGSLRRLGLDYVDQVLVHWPMSYTQEGVDRKVDYLDTWRVFETFLKKGLTRSIGVSNFNVGQLKRLVANSNIKPVTNQVELNLAFGQKELVDYCTSQNIRVVAWAPFGAMIPSRAAPDAKGPKMDDPTLVAIAKKYNKSVTQVVLRYLYQRGIITLPKTVTPSRVVENASIFDFELSQSEFDTLAKFDINYRSNRPTYWQDLTHYPFEKYDVPPSTIPKSMLKWKNGRNQDIDHLCFCTRIAMLLLLLAGLFAVALCDEKDGGKAPRLPLNDGNSMPAMGLGTFLGFDENGQKEAKSMEVENAVSWALDAGYRMIDTASAYNNEVQVGRGVKNSTVPREHVFLVTKLGGNEKRDVVGALRKSLERLNMSYVDLYLIHNPVSFTPDHKQYDVIDYLDTWRQMEQTKKLGLAKSIGVSNFNISQMDRLLANCEIKPSVLQVEVNLNLAQNDILQYCQRHNIAVMAYTPFGNLFSADKAPPPPRASDPTLKAMATKYKKSVAQIVLRYLVQTGVAPIPKSVNKPRIEQNIDIFDFTLTPEEIQILSGFNKNYRTVWPSFWQDHPYYPFEQKAVPDPDLFNPKTE
ncbi:uncharacterized protein LOC134676839 [Cydia fagiglandana]|uniref:uncharacterized protein LOC134676839 n=1 Tax=Cydia fagiglandana TaxID=1458189 RepID=UPI002FEE53DF